MDPNMKIIGGQLRHLPIYLLLDCSSEMIKTPIIAVNEGVELLYRTLISDPHMRETALISLIRFASKAEIAPLVPLDEFIPPTLYAGGRTAIGDALTLLYESITQDLRKASIGQRGDYAPVVFVLTAGRPSDEWRRPLARLRSLRGSQKPTIVALSCGNKVDLKMMREMTDTVYLMNTITSDKIRSFFKWISGSIISNR